MTTLCSSVLYAHLMNKIHKSVVRLVQYIFIFTRFLLLFIANLYMMIHLLHRSPDPSLKYP